ncbi:MAG: hypothetical protein ACRC20_11745 [Segniliparus sp.]|uniref:hypothetical protein n=1 Tax=Segniliparus sp. TaxID=2804064 RepID=UPI003F36F386
MPDPEYPGLSAEGAAEVRRTAMRVLAGLGVETVVNENGTMLRGTDGETFGLDNLMARCGYLPQGEWAGAIAEHYGRMIEARREPSSAELGLPELLARVRSRLMPQSQVDDSPRYFAYSWPVADGLAEVLCLDFPTTVRFFGSDILEKHPGEDWRAAGRRNTAAEPVEGSRMFGEGAGAFHLVYGGSPFLASKLLDLGALVPGHLPPAPLGYVVGVPSRHYLAAHPLRDKATFLEVVQKMGAYCQHASVNHQGPISGELYHWRGGSLQQITRVDPETKEGSIRIEGAFAAAWSEMV